MRRWFPLLLLPIIVFVISKNYQKPAPISDTPTEEPVVENVTKAAVPATMHVVAKRSSARQAARADETPRPARKPKPAVQGVTEVKEQDSFLHDPRLVRRDAKDALSEELARHPEQPQAKENDAYRDEKKWIDSLSGLSLQNQKAKRAQPECDVQRCPLDKPYVDVFGVVFEAENPDLQGTLEQGSYVEKTPAFYIK